MYDKKLAEYKKLQSDLLLLMEQHSNADESYYVEAAKLLELAHRAYEIYQSSKLEEKRELIQYLLQNAKLDGKNLVPTLQMPFDAILAANKTGNWLPLKDLFINRELEFGITLSDLKIAFENLGLQQPRFAIA
jgi:hypothetical protein